MTVQGRTSVETDPVSMRRSTRFRRLIVAFIVVIALAVLIRFARAAGTDRIAEAKDRAPAASLSPSKQFPESLENSFTRGLLR